MDIFDFLTMLGGLSLFLFGMSLMGSALERRAGSRLRSLLDQMTGKPLVGFLTGLGVTAIIQSSSATTVMVVGFVNSGLMTLRQAINVIMGANVGTTVTAWLLSLGGIESSSVWLRLLKPSSFTPVLALIGIVFYMFCKDAKKKDTGTILLGFATLMFGMETMSGAVSPLKDNAAFTGMLTAFSNPVLGMAAGALLTAVIQSSSASVGILQALCLSGVVSYGSAIPIIMGQNIGTCVTALISSVGASKNARRAAFIHLYFNLIGTLVFMVCFYSINHFARFAFLADSANAAGIAVIHSLFNIGCAAVLFPFADALVKLATMTVPDKTAAEEVSSEPPALTALDERFLDSPAFAMQLCRNAADQMAEHAKEAILLAIEVLSDYSEDKIREVIRLERLVDHFEDVLGSFLVKLAGRDLSKEDNHLLSILLHAIGDFERISDHAVNLTESAEKMHEQGLALTRQGKQELDSLSVAVRDIIFLTTRVFENMDSEHAPDVEPLEEVIDGLVLEMKQRHIVRLRSGICSMEAGLILEDILTNYERVSDHCSNVAVTIIEIQSDALDMHEYLDVKIKGGDPHFRQEYMRLKNIYILP